MLKEYKMCYRGAEAELVEKKSKFIASTSLVRTQEEAMDFVEKIRKKHRDARHNCYAYVLGNKGETYKYSDDGEPAGTAGKPMSDLLLNENITNICVVVTRYFGGILLGTGGLVKAYRESARLALQASKLLVVKSGFLLEFELDYNVFGKVKYQAEEEGHFIVDVKYGENVRLKILPEEEFKDSFIKKVEDISMGKYSLTEDRECTYLLDGGRYILL